MYMLDKVLYIQARSDCFSSVFSSGSNDENRTPAVKRSLLETAPQTPTPLRNAMKAMALVQMVNDTNSRTGYPTLP